MTSNIQKLLEIGFYEIIFILFFISSAFAQIYSFEELYDVANKYIAPADIQEVMKKFVKKDFNDCAKQVKLADAEYSTYFSAMPIDIDAHNKQSFLVFPSKYCNAFFGAHAIAYWIIIKNKDNHYDLLYEGHSDGIKILDSNTNGLKDIQSAYGFNFIILKYDGKMYQRVKEGNLEPDK